MFIQSCSSLKKPFPIPDQNGQSVFPFSDQNSAKTLPDGGGGEGAHTYSLYKGVLVNLSFFFNMMTEIMLNMRNNIRISGLSLRAGGRGFPPATMSAT